MHWNKLPKVLSLRILPKFIFLNQCLFFYICHNEYQIRIGRVTWSLHSIPLPHCPRLSPVRQTAKADLAGREGQSGEGQDTTACRSPLALVISNVTDSGHLYKAKSHPYRDLPTYTMWKIKLVMLGYWELDVCLCSGGIHLWSQYSRGSGSLSSRQPGL